MFLPCIEGRRFVKESNNWRSPVHQNRFKKVLLKVCWRSRRWRENNLYDLKWFLEWKTILLWRKNINASIYISRNPSRRYCWRSPEGLLKVSWISRVSFGDAGSITQAVLQFSCMYITQHRPATLKMHALVLLPTKMKSLKALLKVFLKV